VFYNWGCQPLCRSRSALRGTSASQVSKTNNKYAKAIEIKPDDHMTHSDWGAALLAEVQLLKGSDTEAKYAEAHEKILFAKTIIDKTSYNLACLLTLT
jgi:hypothetical protein